MKSKYQLFAALFFLLILSSAAMASENPFSDVPKDHWAYNAIKELAAKDLIEGYPDGLFRGRQVITRYEMAMVTARLAANLDAAENLAKVNQNDLENINKLLAEFRKELDNLGVRVARIEKKFNDKIEQVENKIEQVEKDVDNLKKIKFGGQYRVMMNSSRFGWHPATISDNEETRSFANQRFRTWLNINPNKDVSGYLQIEMGHIMFGENFEWTKVYAGPGVTLPGDKVGVELRRGFLEYKARDLGTFKIGIQDWSDSFGDTLASSDWDFNVGGISFYRDFKPAQLRAGWYKLWEGAVSRSNDDTNLITLDVKVPVNNNSKASFGVYYLSDGKRTPSWTGSKWSFDNGGYSYPNIDSAGGYTGNYPSNSDGQIAYNSSHDLWLGGRFDTKLNDWDLNFFTLYNTGKMRGVLRPDPAGVLTPLPAWSHAGWAFKGEGVWNIKKDTRLGIQVLSSTGGVQGKSSSNEFRTIAQSERDNFGSQGYWSYLGLSSPNGPSDVMDLGIGLQNRGLGLLTAQLKYETPLWKKISGYFAAGILNAQKPRIPNGSKNMGTELLGQLNFDLSGGLQLQLGTAYFLTGNFYKPAIASPKPDNLVEFFARTQLEF